MIASLLFFFRRKKGRLATEIALRGQRTSHFFNSLSMATASRPTPLRHPTSLKDRTGKGLKIQRFFTESGKDPFSYFEYEFRTSRISNPDGSVVFEMKNVEVPKTWSQVATDILAQKYCRKKGVPQLDSAGKLMKDADGNAILGAETSVKMVVGRLASTWRWWGEENGYFETAEDAQAFEDEMKYMLVGQMAAPNSPQWFNTGLAHAYGITGDAQ